MKSRRVLWAALAAVAAAGCVNSTLGPRTVAPAGFDYNEAISRTWDEQMLLNIVRLRYRDSPLFVDISSMTSSYSLRRGAALVAGTGSGPVPTEVEAGASFGFDENPVITYNYLRGQEFAQRMLSPLAPAELRSLAQSGWSIDTLLRVRSGASAPADAAVSVAFRGHWFWIEDSDLDSKTTFGLLRLLVFLKSGDREALSPLVTIPAR